METLTEDLEAEVASFLTFQDLFRWKPFRCWNGFLDRQHIRMGAHYLYEFGKFYIPCRVASFQAKPHTLHALRVHVRLLNGKHRTETISSPTHFHQTFQPLHSPCLPRVLSISPNHDYVMDMGRAGYDRPEMRVGALIDAMDPFGIWYESTIVAVESDRVFVHFMGWEDRWNVYYPMDSAALAPHRTFTRSWRPLLEMHDFVEILDMNRWHRGRVHAIHTDFDEIFVSWYVRQQPHSIFFHSRWVDRNSFELQPLGFHTHAYPREGSYPHVFSCFEVWGNRLGPNKDHVFLHMNPYTSHYSMVRKISP